ncbi:Ca-activated chloride channel family protein [Thermocatellispora tengchongensis]|uniref:Ca-activated chloride channel family protein n=1 Tax=Thermocatellispora tengchongensis TaxID=1073253 RepID=A0A840P522_9ACTN|nr:VWA domain-containing protein [Thermocatellispora tengchongensis]MBB5133003.1 Ca-activated chloride channel family protein [Thermocatellispora tengchongensis]
MTFLSPVWLLLLIPVLAIAIVYVVMHLRRSQYAVRFTNLDLLDKVAPKGPGWRRHVPAALFGVMLVLLVVGYARPTAEVRVPRERATIMVAFDVSASMRATDVAPNRFAAAQNAARQFVRDLPPRFNLGLVAFSSTAAVTVAPTTDRNAVLNAIDRLETDSGTAIGEAVFSSLQAISTLDAQADEEPPPAHIVLLSDGSNTTGRDVPEAATEAGTRRVPVTTIAYGTEEGVIELSGRTVPVPVDGPALKSLADSTGGGFYEAASGDELQAVYDDIGTSVGYQMERQEIWPWFVGLALIGAVLAAGTSMLWFSRIP